MNRGFSKAEVIVIISLILIAIAIIVAFSVGGFNGRSKDINIREGLRILRKESEIFYLANNRNYAAFCSSPAAIDVKSKLSDTHCFDTPLVNGSDGAWAAESKLAESGQYYCVDYKGNEGFATSSTISHADFLCNLIAENS